MTESRNTYLPDELRKRFTLKCSEKNYRKRRKVMGKIDHILKKNHNVMDRLYSSGERMVTVYKLSGMGFNFNYMTSLIENPDAGKYRAFICYDYMYVITDDGKVLIDRNTAILP